MLRKYKPLLLCLAVPLAVGGLAALLTGGGADFYETVAKPPLSPPGWLFPVVWTLLYLLMGVSSYLVWREKDAPGRGAALRVCGIQLAVNFVWPLLFFLARVFLPAFLWLLLLVALVVVMIRRFDRVSSAAAWLQFPYLFWCLFAAYLNLGVYLLNR